MENNSFQTQTSNARMQLEGSFVAPNGGLVMTIYVDLFGVLPPKKPCLVKVSKPEFALETATSVRLSRPSVFRETGEALINDDQEGRVYISTSKSETVEISKEAMALHDRRVRTINAALQLNHLKPSVQSTGETKRTYTTKSELNFGDDLLIYCTSLCPDAGEEDAWRNTFPKEYASFSKIYRPTQFAQALGMGVCEHIGANGKQSPLKASFHGFKTFETLHPLQIVVHGPVLYVDNPCHCIQEARSDWEKICSMIFVKSHKYVKQKEYRFAIMSIPPEVGETFDLTISGALKDCLVPVSSPHHINDCPVMMTEDNCKSREWHETGICKDSGPGSDNRMKEKVVEKTTTSLEQILGPVPHEVKQPEILILERFGNDVKFVHNAYREEGPTGWRIETLPTDSSVMDNFNSDDLSQKLKIPSENQFKVLDEVPTDQRRLLKFAFDPSVPMPPMRSESPARCSPIEMKHVLECWYALNGIVTRLSGGDQERAAASAWYAAGFIVDLVSWFGRIVKSVRVIRQECLAVVDFENAPLSGSIGWATFSGTGTYTLYVQHGITKEKILVYPVDFLRMNRLSSSSYIKVLKKYGWPLKNKGNAGKPQSRST